MLIAIIGILFLSKCLSSGLKWHLASQNLDLNMLVVQQLQERYLAARFIFAYYTAAFDKVAPAQRPSVEGAAIMSSSTAATTATSTSMTYDRPTMETTSTSTNTNTPTPYNGGAATFSSGHEDGLNAWGECFQSGMGMTADFDILFGEAGIFRGLDEFDMGGLMS
ncbi:hypothetical protein G647_09395 [Cladophialophora carrionii CBS 160.54]|uniref:Transcription factor domain-containing protein n=1 Tax=Cladophialophora carrionii CBS 160.54 TaxID=1279043 RepID=V9CYV0_9EURO|nr:uncharacterized protein G647_09395 [Cladophialophora carrionii CBS 160.54]ETI19561.1 hypothetical protein G647_09395 [Cladophialophora carrionii CBS 160.54]